MTIQWAESVTMARVGTEKQRKKELIEATIKSIEDYGFQGTTILTISRQANLSAGIISHYFGSKQGLILATIRHLLEELKQGLLQQIAHCEQPLTPELRLQMIVDTNFACFQQSTSVTRTWLCFWAQALHDPELARLQSVNSRRLLQNLLYSYRQIIPNKERAFLAANMTAAMIDGLWLRSSLSKTSQDEFKKAELVCKQFIATQCQLGKDL
ncbi:MAG: TetR/AcrR family bet gene transcriptional repressor [Oleiphilaceae bacterium]|jgi:TetR/AcrR family transcriptional repressor of bet genes